MTVKKVSKTSTSKKSSKVASSKKPAVTSKKKPAVSKKKTTVKKSSFKVLNQSELINHYAETLDWDRSEVRQFLAAQKELIGKSLEKAGEFVLPGVLKIVTKKIPAKKMPAIKKGTPVRNPSTGEMMPSKGRAAFTKPASIRVKVRPLAFCKKAANGEL